MPETNAKAPHTLERLGLALIDSQSTRYGLWQIESGMHCSIVGTCVNDDDLIQILRKTGHRVSPTAQSHEIHSYSVREAGRDGLFSRSLTKLLNRRFEGAIRIFARTSSDQEAAAAWERLRDSGQIAAAFWATMASASLSIPFKKRVFGEVHMLSHLNGQGAHQLASRLAAAESRIQDLEIRLQRSEAAKNAALEERDSARASPLKASPCSPNARMNAPDEIAKLRIEKRLEKCERALLIARARARSAESTVEQFRDTSAFRPRVDARQADKSSDQPALGGQPATWQGRVLYLGGRASVLPHLREVARRHAADILHHDGGIEDNPHRIEELVARCDAVVCPIDCVSHGACRAAKSVCRRLNKRFVPISSASRSGFERALTFLGKLNETPSRLSNELCQKTYPETVRS